MLIINWLPDIGNADDVGKDTGSRYAGTGTVSFDNHRIVVVTFGGNHQDVRNIDINKVLFAIDKLNSLLNELQYYNILTKEFAADLVSVGNLRKTQEQLTEIISLIRRQFGTYRGDTIRYFVEFLPHYMKGEVSIRQLGNIEEIVTQVITTTVATEMFIKIAGKSLSDPAIINSMNSIINMFTTNEKTKLLWKAEWY